MNLRQIITLVALAVMPATVMLAQSIYDDDIYYNPKNDKKAKTASVTTVQTAVTDTVADFPAADTYTVVTGSTRKVDEYNRRGIFAVVDSTDITADSLDVDDFTYTRRIEQFYNPSVVTSSDDTELVKLYYAEPANINIYVESPDYWGYPYYSYSYWGYPRSSWYWNSWYGPSWSWYWDSWYYPSWSWGWSPAWSPGWGWSWGGSNARPYNPRHPGALTRPGHAGAGSVTAAGNGYRPGASGRHSSGRTSSVLGTGSYRPSTSGKTDSYTRPATGNASRPGANGTYTRPSKNSNNNTSTSRPTYNNNTNTSRPSNSNNSSGSYSRPGRSSGGSFGGGGGSRHSGAGGGGGRGGRR